MSSTRATKRKDHPAEDDATARSAVLPPPPPSTSHETKRSKAARKEATGPGTTFGPLVSPETAPGVDGAVAEAAAAAVAAVVTATKFAKRSHSSSGTTTAGTSPTTPTSTTTPSRDASAAAVAAATTFPSHLNPTDPLNFDHFLFQLLAYRVETNCTNFNVHKDEHPKLYQWLQFLKKEYKNFTGGGGGNGSDAASPAVAATAAAAQLTAQQVAVLESLHVPLTSRGDDHWNRFHELLAAYKVRHGHVLVPRLAEIPGLGDWVTDQRRQYKAKQQGQATQLSDARLLKLEALEFVWHVRNRPEWVRIFLVCCRIVCVSSRPRCSSAWIGSG